MRLPQLSFDSRGVPRTQASVGIPEQPRVDHRIADATSVLVRQATQYDETVIRAAVRGERLNPNEIDWPNFLVAEQAGRIIAFAQIRGHANGTRELGTLLVRPEWRGQGIAARLIDALLGREAGRVYMITGRPYAGHYARWGFQQTSWWAAPRALQFNFFMGSVGAAISALARRRVNRLAILMRDPH